MTELKQEHDLSIGPLRVSRVCEGVEVLFQCFCLLVVSVDDLENVAISSASHLLDDFESDKQVGVDLFTHDYVNINIYAIFHKIYILSIKDVLAQIISETSSLNGPFFAVDLHMFRKIIRY